MDNIPCDLKRARKVFSRIGLALCTILVISSVLQVIWFTLPTIISDCGSWFNSSSWGMWLGTFAPVYLVAVPVGLLILRKIPAQPPQDNPLGTKNFLIFLPIAICLMYFGSIIGNLLSFILSGGNAENVLTDYAMDTNPLKIIIMVILAPMIEEYIFRKQIIDRSGKYGEKAAVFLSAFSFALFHLNLFQFFYAFGLGLVFAYIYTRTGRLRYPIVLHGIINFTGSVIAPWILSLTDLEAIENLNANVSPEEIMALYSEIIPGFVVYILYVMILMGLSIAGLVLLILKCRKLIWKETDDQLPKGNLVKAIYLNTGMVLYILLCLIMILVSLL